MGSRFLHPVSRELLALPRVPAQRCVPVHCLQEVVALIAYEHPQQSPLSHFLHLHQREHVADVVNAAILQVTAAVADGTTQAADRQTVLGTSAPLVSDGLLCSCVSPCRFTAPREVPYCGLNNALPPIPQCFYRITCCCAGDLQAGDGVHYLSC